jgi:hypothetical protein
MVRTFLKVYMELGSSFLFLQERIKDIIIIISQQDTECATKKDWDVQGQHACVGSSDYYEL